MSSIIDAFNAFADAPPAMPVTPTMVTFRVPLVVSICYLITIFGLQAILRVINKGKGTSGAVTEKASSSSEDKSVSLLNRVTAIHNFALSIFSLWLCVGLTRHVITLATQWGALALYCGAPNDHLNTAEGRAAYQINIDVLWYGNIFYLSKYWELFDTILLVLRGKPLTLLHVFHHIAALLICWYAVHDAMGMGWITVWNNTAVHVLMYWYFARSALGHHVWWRSHITTIQILQFVSDFLTSLPYIPLWYNGVACKGAMSVWLCANFVGASLFVLFVHFAMNDKRRPGSAGSKRAAAAAANGKGKAISNGNSGNGHQVFSGPSTHEPPRPKTA